MFGKKRALIDMDKNNDISTKTLDINDANEPDNMNFICYDDKNKFSVKMDIYILLKNYKYKFLITIDVDSTFEDLKEKIKEHLKKSPEFNNINKLNLANMYKKDKNNEKKMLPNEGQVKNFINSGDMIYCNLVTDEFWIKTYYNIQSLNFKRIIKTEYKLKKKMRYKKFKLMLMKGGIQFFVDNIKNTEYTDFNYYLKFFEFKIKKNISILTHNIHNKQKNKMPIEKIINNSSEIIVKLNFSIFEKLVHKNIKLAKLENSNSLRFNEFSDLTFEELMNETKFSKEFAAIKEISDDFLKNQNSVNNPNFLFYSRKKNKNSKIKLFTGRKNTKINENQIPIDELKEEEEDKDDNIIKNEEINTKINNSISKGKINIDIINENDNSDLKLNNIKIDEENEIKLPKKKKEKIKNMIIITKKLLKESRVKRKFNKLISHNDFEKKMEISKNKPKIKLNTSNSNRNLMTYNSNINLLEKKEEDIKIPNRERQDSNEYYVTINNDIKPNSYNEKNILLFSAELKRNSKDELEEPLVGSHEFVNNNDNIIFKDKYLTHIGHKRYKNFKGSLISNNPANTEPFDGASSSHIDDDNRSDLRTETGKKVKVQKLPTLKYNTKNAFFSVFRNRNKIYDIVDDLKSNFNDTQFIDYIKNLFINIADKNTFDNIKMPLSKEVEYLEKEHKFLINQKKDKQYVDIKLGNRSHVHIYMVLLLVLFTIVLLFINMDFLSFYLDN